MSSQNSLKRTVSNTSVVAVSQSFSHTQKKLFREGELVLLSEMMRIPYLLNLNHEKQMFSNILRLHAKLNRNAAYLRHAQGETNNCVRFPFRRIFIIYF